MSRIIVELAESRVKQLIEMSEHEQREYENLEDAAQALGLREVFELLKTFRHSAEGAAYEGFSTAPLLSTRKKIAQRKGAKRAVIRKVVTEGLAPFFAIDLGNMPPERQDALLDALQQLKGVFQSAEYEPTYSSARGSPPPRTRRNGGLSQLHLQAVGANLFPGAGHGIGFADVEVGWDFRHESLKDRPQPPVFPSGVVPEDVHGTSVFGVILGGAKIRGIAPKAAPKALVHAKQLPDSLFDFLDDDTNDNLEYGDILVVEVELDTPIASRGLPIETRSVHFTAIRLAVSLGIVVIAAAGNGNRGIPAEPWDLDEIAKDRRRAPAWGPDATLPAPEHAEVPDSGAILVSGCDLPDPDAVPAIYQVDDRLNFGSRVDSYGWGVFVQTCGSQPDEYIDFDKTSAATAMVAGVALAVQRLAVEKRGHVLSPGQLRALLRDKACGSPVLRNGRIVGFVPHLGKIEEQLARLPEIVVGPEPGDKDFVLCERPVAAGALPTEAGVPLAMGQKRFLYVRARNAGEAAATDVRATAYWSVHDADENADVQWNELEQSELHGIGVNQVEFLGPIELTLPRDLNARSGKVDIVVAAGGRLDPLPMFPPVRNARRTGLSRAEMQGFVATHNSTAIRTIRVG